MSTTWKRTIRDILIIFFIGLIYYLILRITGKGISCFFLTVTGLPCPSCGITRMFVHLSKFEFNEAFHMNQFLFFTWPLFVAECIYVIYKIEDHKDIQKWNLIAIIVFGIALFTFGTLRILYHL